MKKIILLSFYATFGLWACDNVKPNTPEQVETVTENSATPSNAIERKAENEAIGSFVGMFAPNKISVFIEKINGETVEGYSIVAGNQRAFKGTVQDKNGTQTFVCQEPGDDPYDGVFSFTYANNELNGTWQPNDKKLKEKKYSLKRREFKYDPQLGNYPMSSTNLLTPEELEGYIKSDLRIMRNEIYARHGYCFKVKDMREYFDNQDWYMPVSMNVLDNLTDIEKKNQALIKRYEKYAAEYYDNYGR
jgi:hypothetical protein